MLSREADKDSQLPAGLLRNLEEKRSRLAEIQKSLSDPSINSDYAKVTTLSREAGQLGHLVELFDSFQQSEQNLSGLISMENDADMGELARAEIPDVRAKISSLVDQIKSEFVSSEDSAVENFFIEIRAGVGGEEAALFARDLFEMYRRYCEAKGWKFEASDYSMSERGGFKEVIVQVRGDNAYRRLQYESGGHRVQRVPETEAQGRIHTSAATVAIIPELPDVQIEINLNDVEQFGCRGGGPGGQNVNKVETGWFIKHKPSGLQFKMTEHKSQAQNKERAWALLRSTLYQIEKDKQHAAATAQRKSMMGSGNRNERIRTYNFPQNRCTDHRLGGEESSAKNFNLEKVMAGQLDEMIDALIELDTQQRLESL